MGEIAAFENLPAPQAHSDSQSIEVWLHGRSPHTQRAYAADVARFCAGVRKPLPSVTLVDLQDFADSLGGLSPASRYRILSAVKSLLAFGHRIDIFPSTWAASSGSRPFAAAWRNASCRKPTSIAS
jgi:integrase/recombinase XerD